MIVLDVEASGIDPEKNSILAIGALDLDELTNQFYDECRMWDGAKNEPEATAINGFTDKDATDSSKKSEAELLAAFFAWAFDRPKDHTLAAQNVWFDAGFLEAASHRAGVEYPFAKRVLDIHSIAWLHMTRAGKTPPAEKGHSALSSSVIQEYCGIPQEPSPHNALTGALWHAEVLSRMASNKKALPEYEAYEIPWMT
jgi:DNA polymerase III epsilon subunit-like protein